VPQERSRDIQYINKLRILGIYLVVTAHVAIWLAMESPAFSLPWWVCSWLFYLGHAAIPVFVMISGALLLDDARREPACTFYARRLYRVGIPLVAWTAVYLVVRVHFHEEGLTIARAAALIFRADLYYHLWFLYMIFGLYLITPPLRAFVRRSTRRVRLTVIVLGLVLANVYFQTDALLWNHERSILTLFLPFIPYYLCGYELRRIDPKSVPSRYLALAAVLSASYLAAFFGVFMERQGGVGVRYLFDFFTPPVMFLSVGIFWAAYLHHTTAPPLAGIRKTALEWIASTTLGIYVLHPLVLDCLGHALGSRAGKGTLVVGIVAVPFVAYVACYLMTSLLMCVPVLRRTVT
jgi:surface polysaccharide O-acyltransferase-like enzyme